jgi:hypothetical protein
MRNNCLRADYDSRAGWLRVQEQEWFDAAEHRAAAKKAARKVSAADAAQAVAKRHAEVAEMRAASRPFINLPVSCSSFFHRFLSFSHHTFIIFYCSFNHSFIIFYRFPSHFHHFLLFFQSYFHHFLLFSHHFLLFSHHFLLFSITLSSFSIVLSIISHRSRRWRRRTC